MMFPFDRQGLTIIQIFGLQNMISDEKMEDMFSYKL